MDEVARDTDEVGRRRSARGWTALSWLAANAVLGYLLAWPLMSGVVFVNYSREDSGTYHRAEMEIAGAFAVIGCGLLLAVWALANRALVPRLPLSRWYAAVAWVAALVMQAAPFAWFMLATDHSVAALLFFW
jgi:hypothetical protein